MSGNKYMTIIPPDKLREIKDRIKQEGWEDTPLGGEAEKHDIAIAIEEEERKRREKEAERQYGDDNQRRTVLLDDDDRDDPWGDIGYRRHK